MDYAFYPKDRSNQQSMDKIENDLKALDSNLWVTKSTNLGRFCWIASIEPDQADDFGRGHKDVLAAWQNLDPKYFVGRTKPASSNMGLRAVGVPSPPEESKRLSARDKTLLPRTGKITWDLTMRDDIKYISQPPGVPIRELPDYYYHDDSLGNGVVVYVSDSGAALDTSDLNGVNIENEWIFAGPNSATDKKDSNLISYHGTCSAGRVAGVVTGVAKKATLVINRYTPKTGDGYNEHGIDSLVKIYDHIKSYHVDKKVVINMSWGQTFTATNSGYNDALKETMSTIIKELVKLGNAVPVAAAGNEDHVFVYSSPSIMYSLLI
ncbi:hypothetical protein LTR50_003061 [Elasticomyces elasticus]|nr:hypothetical protein LTR50_003061 [Elasticomyces elasticus]